MLPGVDMTPDPAKLEAAAKAFEVVKQRAGARSMEPRPLEQMLDQELLEWLELQVLAAQERLRAAELAKKGDSETLRAMLRHLITADYSLVRRATGWPPPYIIDFVKVEDRMAIVLAQDTLNGLDKLAPMLEPYAAKAALGE